MKYIIANIKVPIETNNINGGFTTYMERASIEFSDCDELPPEQEMNHTVFLSNMSSFLGTPLKDSRVKEPNKDPPIVKTIPKEIKIDRSKDRSKIEEEEPISEEEYHYSSELESDSESENESENEINDEMMHVKQESFVLKTELSNTLPKHNNNVSFKKTPSKSSRFTQKKRV